jgi:hypothetical protein
MGEVGEILSRLPNILKGVTKEGKAKARRKLRPGKKKEGGSHGENPFRG